MNSEFSKLQEEYNKLKEKYNILEKKYSTLSAAKNATKTSRYKEKEDFNRALFELSPAAIFILDKEGTIIDANPAYTKAIQYKYEELVGKKVYMVASSKKDYPLIDRNIARIIAGASLNHTVKSRRKDGSYCYMQLTERRIILPNGEYGVLSMAEDITKRKLTEEGLRESEEQFRLLAENANDVIWTMNARKQFTFISPSIEKLRGYTAEEALNQTLEETLTPQSLQVVKKALKKFQASRNDGSFYQNAEVLELEQYRKDGSTVWTEIVINKILNENGRFKFFLGVSRDISERKAAESALRESEQRYRILVETTPDAVSIFNSDGQILFCNNRTAELFGYTKDEIIGLQALNLVPRHAQEKALTEMNTLLTKGIVSNKELDFMKKDGTIFTGEFSATILKSDQKSEPTFVDFIKDITDRKKVQQALVDSEKKYRSFFMDDLTGDFLTTADGKILDCNPAFLEIFGIKSLAEARSINAILLYNNKTNRQKLINKIKKEKRLKNYKAEMRKITGEKLVVIENVVGIFDENNKLIRMRGYLIDITSQKQAEDALIASEKSYRELFNNATEAIYIQDLNGAFIDVNHTVEKMYGYNHDYFIGKTPEVLAAPGMNDLEKIGKQIQLAAKGKPQQFEFWAIRKNGEVFPKEVRLNTAVYFGKKVITAFARDITERKQAEISLRESEEKFRSIVQESIDGITLIDEKGRIIEWNHGQEHITGLKRRDVIGKNIWDIQYKILNKKKKGSLNVAKIKETTLQILENGITENSNNYEETYIIRSDGRERLVQSIIFPVKTLRGFMAGGVSRDITEQRRVEEERRKLEKQIQHAQKLESLGVLAGGIAHDFNNLLTGILGNTGLAEMELDETSTVLPNLKNIENSAIRAAELCRQLLAYSGKGKFVVKAIDLNHVVEEMANLLETSISKKITIKYDFDKTIPAIEVDTAQIRQVIMNLIINASDAIENNVGRISLATGSMYCTSDYLKTTYLDDNLAEGNYVYLEVSDTGHGMDKETLKRIFDPFYTTKFTGRGLGLAAVLGIIRGHKGAIKIDSQPNAGTAFRIFFPGSEKKADAQSHKSLLPDNWRGSGHILVVDDEEPIRVLCKSALEMTGFDVLTAADGREAIEVYKNHDNIRLVILDMTMPYLNGEETFKEMQKINPSIPVLLSSGYNEQEAINNFAGKGLAGFMQKPYKASELIRKIKNLLDKH